MPGSCVLDTEIPRNVSEMRIGKDRFFFSHCGPNWVCMTGLMSPHSIVLQNSWHPHLHRFSAEETDIQLAICSKVIKSCDPQSQCMPTLCEM